jgi:hypothetical protein
MAKSNFIVRGGADFNPLYQELNKSQKRLKGFKNNINGTFKTIGKLTGLAIGAKALVDFGKQSIQVASDLTEVQNVVDVTFGSMAKEVNEFASSATKEFGLSELSAKKFTSTMGAMLKSSGISGTQAKDMSIEVAKLTADMASFYNLDHDEAFTKIQSGLSGETEPLKRLGINMNVANLEAYNLSQGITKAWKDMTQAEQVLTRYNYLMHVSADAQGDFARNTGTWANQTKLLKEQWQEFMGLIGNAIIEVLLPFVKALNKVLEIVNKVLHKIGELYSAITGKNLVAESNSAITDTADEAADSEVDLSKGIDKASKAAKRALAPFDELNVLQGGLANGDGLGGSGLNVGSIGGLTSDISEAGSGVKGLKKEFEDFFFILDNFDKRGFFKELVKAPEVEQATVPVLDDKEFQTSKQRYLTPVPAPSFSPAFAPRMALEQYLQSKSQYQETVKAPEVEQATVPVLDAETYFVPSLEGAKLSYLLAKEYIKAITVPIVIPSIDTETYFISSLENTKLNYQTAIEYIRGITVPTLLPVGIAFATLFSGISTNAAEWKQNLITQFGELVTNISFNAGQLKEAVVQNIAEWTTSTQASISKWGIAVAAAGLAAATNFTYNFNEALNTTANNISDWINTTSGNIAEWGRGMLSTAAETARGIVKNISSGLETAWMNFKNALSAMGEKIKGSFRPNYGISTVETIGITTSIVGNMFKAMSGNFKTLGVPGLATGAVIPPNSEFLAVLGDQKSGTNIETPERLLRQIVREELGGAGRYQMPDTQINMYLDDDIIGRAVVAWIDKQVARSGELPFSLGEL